MSSLGLHRVARLLSRIKAKLIAAPPAEQQPEPPPQATPAPLDERLTKNFLKDLIANKQAHVGDHTYGHPSVLSHWNDGFVSIGKYGSIAEQVVLLPGGNHRGDYVTTYPFRAFKDRFPASTAKDEDYPISRGPILIGNDVWLGVGCTILSGVTIGDGAIIGARAVVSRDVPPYAIAVGNPARIVKYRFPAPIIARLLAIKWWDWPDEKVNAAVNRIDSADIEAFLAWCTPTPEESQLDHERLRGATS
jgi:acetyltransferase-like isoleucine patch superfamily enzyme